MEPKDLPRVDEHAVAIAAGPDVVWPAVLGTVRRSFSGVRAERVARLLGCESTAASAWSRPAPGCSLAGFRIAAVEPPVLITLTGRHRFSEYALTFRVDETNGGVQCRAESRARFPGWHGRLYRYAVVGSRGHRVMVRRMLAEIKRVAEQAPSRGRSFGGGRSRQRGDTFLPPQQDDRHESG